MISDQEPGFSTSHKLIIAITPTLLLGLNLLIFGTFVVYSENRSEFLISYSSALGHYYLPGFVAFIAIGLLPLLLGKRARKAFNVILIVLGVLTYIHGNLLLWNTGILDGTQLDFTENWRSLVDLLLWAGLAWAAYRYSNWLLVHGWKICAILILFQTIGVFSILYDRQDEPGFNLAAFPQELEMFSTNSNVIHIVLDGFQANIFEELLAKDPNLHESFSGFTMFRDATTPSDVTYLSVPATLSGKPFKNQLSISEYLEETLNGDNLYRFFASEGFKVDVATPLLWNHSNALFSSYYRIPKPYAGKQEVLLSSVLLLGDISLFRQVPHFLKPLIYRSGTWLLSGILVPSPEQQFEHFSHNAFVADLQNRMTVTTTQPRYKFMHLVTPHAPFVSSSDCKFAGTTLEYSKQAFIQQSLCTLKTITAFLDRLKELGVYDNSMFVIHGDHGGGIAFDMVTESGTKTTSSEALHHVWGNPLPLVLIKPPGEKGALKISNKQVQLLDIPITVTELLGFSSEFPGNSMFGKSTDVDVERVYFHSKVQRNVAMAKDSFDEFTGYHITGSVYQLASWQKVESFEAQLTNDAGKYIWGTNISFGNNGNFQGVQNGGWIINAAKDVTWTDGNRAVLSINFSETNAAVTMRVRVKPLLAPGKLEHQRVNIFVGTKKVGEWLVSIDKFHNFELNIPQNLIERIGKTEISFQLPDASSLHSLGIGSDKRILALAFYAIQFEHSSDKLPPK